MQTIDIRNNNLIPDEYMLLTKAGKRWRPNWSKMVADKINIIAHSNVYTLTDRFKKEGKYYLVFTDGTNNYIERQDKAKRNKKLAKDTVIEAVKRVIAGLLPAPKPVINKIIEEVEQITNKHFNSHNNPSEYYHSFKSAVAFIKRNRRFYRDKLPGYYRELSNCYHPDRCNTHLYQQPYTAEDYMSVIQTLR